jgi:hypothetical protein
MTISPPALPMRVWDDPRVVFPDEETWARLSLEEREDVIERIFATISEYQEAMSEGVRHFRSKVGAGADLEGHFRRAGRAVFVACELAVFYPREPVIVPDVLAVMDCDPDLEPDSWVVQDQGRGIDLVIEMRNRGKKHKTLVECVEDYSRRRIPEYFAYDCRRATLRGWRLTAPGAQSYRPIVPQGGYFASRVLGLDLGVYERHLRFFTNGALVPNERELAGRLQAAVDQQRASLEEAERERERASRELTRTMQERDRVAQERDQSNRELAHVQATLASNLLDVCRARSIALDPEHHARVVAEMDVGTLLRWFSRAAVVSDEAAIFAEEPSST